MDLINNLLDYFKKPKEETQGKSPKGTCPVCWGYQEYDAKIRTIFKDKQIDVNNHRDSYLKVKKFVVKHIDGAHLKKENYPPALPVPEKKIKSLKIQKILWRRKNQLDDTKP